VFRETPLPTLILGTILQIAMQLRGATFQNKIFPTVLNVHYKTTKNVKLANCKIEKRNKYFKNVSLNYIIIIDSYILYILLGTFYRIFHYLP